MINEEVAMHRKIDTMKAAVLNRFGGPEEFVLQRIDVPKIGHEDVLIRVEYAGVGEWDAFERQGGYAAMLGIEPKFPYVLGSEGAGTVAATGECNAPHCQHTDREEIS
jgi:NADPH2:quinone reductase